MQMCVCRSVDTLYFFSLWSIWLIQMRYFHMDRSWKHQGRSWKHQGNSGKSIFPKNQFSTVKFKKKHYMFFSTTKNWYIVGLFSFRTLGMPMKYFSIVFNEWEIETRIIHSPFLDKECSNINDNNNNTILPATNMHVLNKIYCRLRIVNAAH